VALAQLHVDIRESLRHPLSHRNETVVDDDAVYEDQGDDPQKYPFHDVQFPHA